MHIIILIAAGVLVVLVGSGDLVRRQVKVKLLHGQLHLICPGRVVAVALLLYIAGGVIAMMALGTAALWGERFWSTITGIVPYRPFWFGLWVSVFLGSVMISVLGFVIGLITASKKSRDLEQRVQAVIQGLT